MIPEIFIENWRRSVPWQMNEQIEQDLIISRALVNLYNDPHVKNTLVFRGGTALNKLFITPPARYSEDIDFVQRNPDPIGQTINLNVEEREAVIYYAACVATTNDLQCESQMYPVLYPAFYPHSYNTNNSNE